MYLYSCVDRCVCNASQKRVPARRSRCEVISDGYCLACRNNECEDATDAETDYGDDAAEDAEEMEDAIMDGEEDFGSQGSVHDALHDSTPRWNEMCSQ